MYSQGKPMIDFSQHSNAEIQSMIEDLQHTLKTRQKAEQASIVQQIRKLAASIGATVEIRFEDSEASVSAGKRGGKVAPRYRNPANHDQTWTGRGIKPRWIQDYESAGRHISEFLISSVDQSS